MDKLRIKAEERIAEPISYLIKDNHEYWYDSKGQCIGVINLKVISKLTFTLEVTVEIPVEDTEIIL